MRPRPSFLPFSPGRGRGQAGFTLIELSLVILIIGVMLAITVPRIGNRAYAQLGSETRKLALAFRYLRHAAILTGRSYRLVYDIDQQKYWPEVGQVATPPSAADDGVAADDFSSSGGDVVPEERFTIDREGPLEVRKLPEPIGFSDVNLPLVAGKVFEGVVWTTFYPDGYVDLSIVHLDNGQDVYTLYLLNSITGKVFIEPGYLSWNQ